VSKAYWNWVTRGFIYKINKDLLVVMEIQLKGIRKKIKLGALARIYETENLQYIMKRKTQIIKSLQSFKESGNFQQSNGDPGMARKEGYVTSKYSNRKKYWKW